MKTIPLTCPKCGANLDVDEKLTQCFCQYCGTKILIDKGERVFVYRDEAKVVEAETESKVRLQELEWEKRKLEKEEQTEKETERKRKLLIKICIPLTTVYIIYIIILLVIEAKGLTNLQYYLVGWIWFSAVILGLYYKIIRMKR